MLSPFFFIFFFFFFFFYKINRKTTCSSRKNKEYLENNLGFDLYSMHKLKCSSIFIISFEKARNNSQPLVTFMIKNVHVLNNYLIPLSEDGFIKR